MITGLPEVVVELLEQLPMAILIHKNGYVVDCNSAAIKLASFKKKDGVLGKSILSFLTEKSQKKAIQFMTSNAVYSNELFQLRDGKKRLRDVEIKKNYFKVENAVFTFLLINDVTDMNKGLRHAAKIQRLTMNAQNTAHEQLEFVQGYHPKEIVSGDFYFLNQYDATHLLGILGDVKGKGIGAALSISAMKILFYDSGKDNTSTRAMASHINRNIHEHLGEEFVASIMYRIDLEKSEISVTCAGIAEFIMYTEEFGCQVQTLKGPYLGMLEEDLFENKYYEYKPGTEIFFFSDGYEDYEAADLCERMNRVANFKARVDILEGLCDEKAHDDMTYIGIRRKEAII